MKNFIKKPTVIILIAISISIIAGYFYFTREKKPKYEFVVVQRGDIIQEVSVTGWVKPAENVNLAFEKNGRISAVYTKIGDRVKANQILAQLDNTEIYAQLIQARADLKTQQAKLEELKRGAREEEIKIQEIKAENAKTSVEEAKKSLIDKIQDAYSKSDDAIRNKIDKFFKDSRSPFPQIIFFIADSRLESDVEWQRLVIEEILKAWQFSLTELNPSSDLNYYLNAAKNNLNQVKSFLDKTTLAVNSAVVTPTISQTSIDSWRADVSAARININTAISNLLAAEEKLKTAEANFALSQQELILKKAGATEEVIKMQEAQVEKAQANVLNYEIQLAKTILSSPINGVVTKQDAKIGEIVSANTPVISVISETKFKVEADIYEEDVVKIKVGNSVEISLVAFPREKFSGRVISISPGEKIVDGVVYYKVTIDFEQAPEGIKSTMTADIVIRSDAKKNVLTIPRNAVQRREGKTIVEVLENNLIQEREIKVGIWGVDDMVEVTSGLREGEKVIQR